MKYEAACEKCSWIFKESVQPQILDMPTNCVKCKGNMMVRPVVEKDARDYNYEIFIQCKENGESIRNGFNMPNNELLVKDVANKNSKFIKRCSESFARMITKEGNVGKLIKVN